MADYKLEEGMKNHPGFMPFSHTNTNTNIDDIKEEKKTAAKDNT